VGSGNNLFESAGSTTGINLNERARNLVQVFPSHDRSQTVLYSPSAETSEPYLLLLLHSTGCNNTHVGARARRTKLISFFCAATFIDPHLFAGDEYKRNQRIGIFALSSRFSSPFCPICLMRRVSMFCPRRIRFLFCSFASHSLRACLRPSNHPAVHRHTARPRSSVFSVRREDIASCA